MLREQGNEMMIRPDEISRERSEQREEQKRRLAGGNQENPARGGLVEDQIMHDGHGNGDGVIVIQGDSSGSNDGNVQQQQGTLQQHQQEGREEKTGGQLQLAALHVCVCVCANGRVPACTDFG